MWKYKKKFPAQPTSKFKSKLEEDFNNFLEQNHIKFGYEDYKVNFLKPEKPSKYTPDFNCPAKDKFKIIFETKGQFLTSDRKKHLLIKQQHPDLDIRFVFSNSRTKIGKKSKTTYGRWFELKGFNYHCIYSTKKFLPDEWVKQLLQQQAGF